MPLIEAALAFAITMLALSLVCSSLVEIIHRAFKMRENGLMYMLEQLFDQVLAKYVEPLVAREAEAAAKKRSSAAGQLLLPTADDIDGAFRLVRHRFVDLMTSNRAPMGLKADPTLAVKSVAPVGALKPPVRPGNIWGGRRIAALGPLDFMERLGSIDVGDQIASAADIAEAKLVGARDAILKDIAQKFEGFGKDAAGYFEGRARFMSVAVAIVLAIFVHVHALDLFRTYLRDPNARAKAIEQSQALTAQYKAAQDATDAAKNLATGPNAIPADTKAELDKIKKDLKAAIDGANTTVMQFADLGAPLGWTDQRMNEAKISVWIWTCKKLPENEKQGFLPWNQKCKSDGTGYAGVGGLQYVDAWLWIPRTPSVWLSLVLGGLLVGLGSPFWYDAVTGLTNIRNAGNGQVKPGAPVSPNAAANAQPVTAVGAFKIANTARQ